MYLILKNNKNVMPAIMSAFSIRKKSIQKFAKNFFWYIIEHSWFYILIIRKWKIQTSLWIDVMKNLSQ